MVYPFIDTDLRSIEQAIEGLCSSPTQNDRANRASGITREITNIKDRIEKVIGQNSNIDTTIRKISQNVVNAGSATGSSVDTYCDDARRAVQELRRLLRRPPAD